MLSVILLTAGIMLCLGVAGSALASPGRRVLTTVLAALIGPLIVAMLAAGMYDPWLFWGPWLALVAVLLILVYRITRAGGA